MTDQSLMILPQSNTSFSKYKTIALHPLIYQDLLQVPLEYWTILTICLQEQHLRSTIFELSVDKEPPVDSRVMCSQTVKRDHQALKSFWEYALLYI